MLTNTDEQNPKDKAKSGRKKKRLGMIINKYFIFIAFGLFLVVLIVGYFLMLKDNYASLNQAQDKLSQAKSAVMFLSKEHQAMIDSQAQSPLLSPTEDRLFSLALPKSFDLPSAIIQLTELCKATGFMVTKVDVIENNLVATSASGQKVGKANLSLSVVGGDYDAWKRLLLALEQSVMIVDVSSIDFNSQSANYKLNLTAYYYPDTDTKQ
ncbi:MAG: hypothetical protein WCP18_00215 [bacterium]